MLAELHTLLFHLFAPLDCSVCGFRIYARISASLTYSTAICNEFGRGRIRFTKSYSDGFVCCCFLEYLPQCHLVCNFC